MNSPKVNKTVIPEIYQVLYHHFGPQHWWPGETALEVVVGAVLTQNTNWKNVEKAIYQLKKDNCLSIDALYSVSVDHLASLIKPAGYFNVKARRLKNVVGFIHDRYDSSILKMKKQPVDILMSELLSINGVGPETADSILLYALEKTAFVVDAYTKRFMMRHNLVADAADYHGIQEVFVSAIGHDQKIYNEYHALIVRLGKDYCKTTPLCEKCPLNRIEYNMIDRCQSCYRGFIKGEKRYATKDRKTRCFHCYNEAIKS